MPAYDPTAYRIQIYRAKERYDQDSNTYYDYYPELLWEEIRGAELEPDYADRWNRAFKKADDLSDGYQCRVSIALFWIHEEKPVTHLYTHKAEPADREVA